MADICLLALMSIGVHDSHVGASSGFLVTLIIVTIISNTENYYYYHYFYVSLSLSFSGNSTIR